MDAIFIAAHDSANMFVINPLETISRTNSVIFEGANNNGYTLNEDGTTITGALKVTSDVTIDNCLTVSGISSFNDIVEIDGNNIRIGINTETDKVNIKAETTIDGKSYIKGTTEFTGLTELKGNSNIYGETCVSGKLTVTGNTILGNGNNDLTVNCWPSFQKGLIVEKTGKTVLKGNVEIGESTSYFGFTVNEASVFNNKATFQGNTIFGKTGDGVPDNDHFVEFYSKSHFYNPVSLSGAGVNLTVDGTTTLNNSFTVHGKSIFKENIKLEKTSDDKFNQLNIEGSATIGSGLKLSENTTGKLIIGKYNNFSDDMVFAIGNGSNDNRKNVFQVKDTGRVDITSNEVSPIYINGKPLITATLPISFNEEERTYQFTNGLNQEDEGYESVSFSLDDLRALKKFINNNLGMADGLQTIYDEENDEIIFSSQEDEIPENGTIIENENNGSVIEDVTNNGIFIFTNGLKPDEIGYDHVDFNIAEFKALKAFITNNNGMSKSIGSVYSSEENKIIFKAASDLTQNDT